MTERNAVLLGLAVVVGCGGSGGKPDRVTGTLVNTCHQGGGDVDIPRDMSKEVNIQAYVPDASAAGYRVVTGAGHADGTFEIDGVPDGATYVLDLRPAVASLYVTDQHDLELHGEFVTRCRPVPTRATAPAVVDVDLAGMATPFDTQHDRMELVSLAVGYSIQLPFDPNPFGGFSAMAEWPQGAPLVDASAGDDLFVLHMRSQSVLDPVTNGYRTASQVLDAFDATGKSLQVGPATVITGQFPPPAPVQTGSLTIDHTQFTAGTDAFSTVGDIDVLLTAHPVAESAGRFSAMAVAEINWFNSRGVPRPAGVSKVEYSYADPFPASWKRALSVEYSRFRYLKLSAKDTLGFVGGYVERGPASAALTVAPPQLSSPGQITIAGADFLVGGKIAFDGTAPIVVRWAPVPSATLYRLSWSRSLNDPSMQFDVVTTIITTADTTLSVPAALFQSGGIYALSVTAMQAPLDYRAGQLLGPLFPSASATTLSGRFRFSATCGNGIVDPDEDCDTSGESATCNIDCTAAMCGDGLRNAAAGEACDVIFGSASCTDHCTLPAP